MKFSDNSMSAVLLCSYMGINNDDAYKPLTLKEWNELLDSVLEHGQQPSVVMDPSQSFLRETDCSQAYIERIKRLMSRAGTVAFQLDELEGKGIDIVTQFDADYPVLMKRRLKKKTPPVLFYSGDIGLAKKIGIGVAGSRNVTRRGLSLPGSWWKKQRQSGWWYILEERKVWIPLRRRLLWNPAARRFPLWQIL